MCGGRCREVLGRCGEVCWSMRGGVKKCVGGGMRGLGKC